MSPNTERRYRDIFAATGLLVGDPADLPGLEELRARVEAKMPSKSGETQASSVSQWRLEIERLHRGGAGPRAIYDWLKREQKQDFSGSYSAVKRMCRGLSKSVGPKATDVAIPIHAPPGEAQVDFGYLGLFYDPATGKMPACGSNRTTNGCSIDGLVVAELIVTLKRLAGESTSEAELILRLTDASIKAHIIDITDELPSGLRKALGDLPGHYESYIEHVGEKGFPTCDTQTAWNAAFWGKEDQEATIIYKANCHWMLNLLLSGKRPTQADEGASIYSSVQGRGPHRIVAPDKVQIGDIAAFLTGVSVRADSGGDTIPVGTVIHVGLVIRVSGAGTDDIQVLEKMDPRQPINTRTVAEILNDSISQRATVIFLRPHSGSQAP